MISKNEFEKEIANYASSKQIIIESEAIPLLNERQDYKKLIDELIELKEFVITKQQIEELIVSKTTKIDVPSKADVKESKFIPHAKDVEPRIRILSELNITGQSNSECSVNDFTKFFRDKFSFLSSLLKKRNGLNPKPLSRLSRINKGSEVDVVGMVNKKWVSKNGHFCMKLEDEESECIALILKDDQTLMRESESVLLDDVIGVKAVKGEGEMVIIKQLFHPEFPMRKQRLAERDLSLCITSDTHVGSKLFLEKEFSKFIEWINGRVGSEKDREVVGKIKYLVFAGDNVDGIGVYPSQYEELNIPDIYKQYEVFSDYVKEIPEYIEIFIGPGQHDAVRRADPQPAIPKEYVSELYDLKNIHFLSSPGWFEIEGLKVLMYHGASMHDIYSSISNLDAKKPEKAITEVLKRGTLGPVYGMNQPYVPEEKDYMLIRELPDLYIGGDMHHTGYGMYRGTTIINSSTWQKQTDFQVKMGHSPTPGIVPIFDLKTGKIHEHHFCRPED